MPNFRLIAENNAVVSTSVLGFVECAVGGLDPGAWVRDGGIELCNSQADRELEGVAFVGNGELFNSRAQPLCHNLGAAGVRVCENDSELFATVTPGDIDIAQCVFYHLCGAADHLVSGGVAVGIVNLFKVVDIKHQQ